MKLKNPLLSIFMFLIISSCSKKAHPLEALIGLPVVSSNSESILRRSSKTMVYSKAGVEYDLYAHICGKVKSMYGDDRFEKGCERNDNTIGPETTLLIGNDYTKNFKRCFEIRSKSGLSCIIVIEYEDYVAVLLASGS